MRDDILGDIQDTYFYTHCRTICRRFTPLRELRWLTRQFIVFAYLLLSDVGSVIRADDNDVAAHLLNGLWHSREMLVSGECQIRLSVQDGDDRKLERRFFLAFDIDQSRWRLDFDGELSTKYSEIDGISYFYTIGSYAVEKNLAGRQLSPNDCRPLDPRIVGVCQAGDIEIRAPYDRLKERLRSLRVEDVKESASGEMELTLAEEPEGDSANPYVLTNVYRIDAEQGVVLAIESMVRFPNTGVAGTTQRSTAKWKVVNGVLIPIEFETVYLQDNSRDLFQFEWTSVNQPVPASRFEFRDFGLPPGTIIVDTRLGKPVTVEVIAQPSAAPKPRHATWINLVIGIGAIGVVMALILVWRLRIRRQGTTKPD